LFCFVGPVGAVAFVDAVDGAFRWDAHVGVSEDEFTEGVVLENND
jgi:hypothetical protein